MTLVTKLEDSEEGLIGFTKDGHKVHLGVPLNFAEIESLNTDDSHTATERKYKRAEEFEKQLDAREDYCYFNKDGLNAGLHTSDIKLRRFFSDGKFVRDYSVVLNWMCFQEKKEKAFQNEGQTGYSPDRIYGENYVKLHRVGEKK